MTAAALPPSSRWRPPDGRCGDLGGTPILPGMDIRPVAVALAFMLGCGGEERAADGEDAAPEADGGPDAALPPAFPAGWADVVALPRAPDLDPDPRVVEIALEARVSTKEFRPGVEAEVWTYDGVQPGPLIEARVGDRLVVHFRNRLPEPTTIHWHGLRVPAAMDGTERTQDPVPPGGEFEYAFDLPDAGTYWYHPHVRSDVQVGRGLYGALVVRDPDEPPLGEELVVVLDDVLLSSDGQLAPPDAGGHFGDVFGREGQVLLVNGAVMPVLPAPVGHPQRWRVVNAANARYFRFRLPGQVLQVGTDGGLLEAPVPLEDVVLVPGGRIELVWIPEGTPGTEALIQWLPVDRGHWSDRREPEDLMRVRFTAGRAPPVEVPSRLREIAPLDLTRARPQALRLTQDTVEGRVVMGINGAAHHGTVVRGFVGETQVWTVENTTDASHPFHLHGYFFQTLDARDRPIPAWRDTVDVPLKSTVKLAVHFDGRPGEWMFHCHILEHAELGMMGLLRVEE